MSNALSTHDFVTGPTVPERLNEPWRRRSATGQFTELSVHQSPPHLPHAAGANLGVRRACHEAIGGFDESLLIWDDTDYCWRQLMAGTSLHWAQDAVVHYRLRHSPIAIFRQARGYGENNVKFYRKYRAIAKAPELRPILRDWARLPRSFLKIRDMGDLTDWLWKYGWMVGHLRACARYRVMAPLWWV